MTGLRLRAPELVHAGRGDRLLPLLLQCQRRLVPQPVSGRRNEFTYAGKIAKIGTATMNVALGFSALHALFVHRAFLPRELRPNWFMQAGVIFCGLFFFSISAVLLQ